MWPWSLGAGSLSHRNRVSLVPRLTMTSPGASCIPATEAEKQGRDLICFNSLWPSDTIWRYTSGSTLARVMAWCLVASSHYLNQCWLFIKDDLWHSHYIIRNTFKKLLINFQTSAFMKMYLKMSSAECWPFCSCFNWSLWHHKNIERHTAHTIVSWPNPKQWVIVHTSNLMVIIRQSIYIFSIITRKMGKLNTHSPTYCIMDNCSSLHVTIPNAVYKQKIWFSKYTFIKILQNINP